MNILVLEDDPERQNKFRKNFIGHSLIIVDTATEAISLLSTRQWQWLFLDHDLGGKVFVFSGKGTGYEVACWLEEHPDRIPDRVIIHSFNPAGMKRMAMALKEAYIVPGAWDMSDIIENWENVKGKFQRGIDLI